MRPLYIFTIVGILAAILGVITAVIIDFLMN